MTAASIAPGMTLKLKPSRMHAYGLTDPHVTVTALKRRDGYKVPWVVSGTAAFKPSDFA